MAVDGVIKGAKMTPEERELLKKFINTYSVKIPENHAYWIEIGKGIEWLQEKMPDSDITILAEKYLHACMEIATIEQIAKGELEYNG